MYLRYMYICYTHLASARFEHSVCRGSLKTTLQSSNTKSESMKY